MPSARLPAVLPREFRVIANAAAVHPAVSDVSAANPIGLAVEAAAPARRVGVHRVWRQLDTLVAASEGDRLFLKRLPGLQLLVLRVDRHLACVGVGQEFGVGGPSFDRHQVTAVWACGG